MEPLARVTPATVDVLSCLVEASEPTWGLLVIKGSGRPAGTVCPILERLERAAWVESEWDDDTKRAGPRRRLYRLTEDGALAAHKTVEAFAARSRPSTVRSTGATA